MSEAQNAEIAPLTERDGEERMAAALAPFGWTCTEDFWQRYYSDAWVFNLANAVERLTAEVHALRAENVDLVASREAWVQKRSDEISRDLAALADENQRLQAMAAAPVLVSTAVDYCITHHATNHGRHEGGMLASCRFRQLFYFENPMDEHTFIWSDPDEATDA